jgi:hypothetical protein
MGEEPGPRAEGCARQAACSLKLTSMWVFIQDSKNGSFLSAGEALIVASHISPLLQGAPHITRSCIVSDTIHQIRWIHVYTPFFPDWLSGTERSVNICQRKVVNCKGVQSKHCPSSLGLSVYHKFSLKSTVHNRGHILAATQVVKFNGYFWDSDKYL